MYVIRIDPRTRWSHHLVRRTRTLCADLLVKGCGTVPPVDGADSDRGSSTRSTIPRGAAQGCERPRVGCVIADVDFCGSDSCRECGAGFGVSGDGGFVEDVHARPADGERSTATRQVGSAHQVGADPQRADVVAVLALRCWFVCLEDVIEVEQALDPLAMPDQVVERSEERGVCHLAARQTESIGAGPRLPGPSFDHDGGQTALRQQRTRRHGAHSQVVGEVVDRANAHGVTGAVEKADDAFVVAERVIEKARGNGAVGHVEQAMPGRVPSDANEVSGPCEELNGGLRRAPIPAAGVRFTLIPEVAQPQGSERIDPSQQSRAQTLRWVVATLPRSASTEGPQRPIFDLNQGSGMGWILESEGLRVGPESRGDVGDGAVREPGGDGQEVRLRQGADRIQLHAPEAPQNRGRILNAAGNPGSGYGDASGF